MHNHNPQSLLSGTAPIGSLVRGFARTVAFLLMAAFPVTATLVDETANGYWGLLILMGMGALATMRGEHWRALLIDNDIKWPILLIAAYVAIATLSYVWIDGSEFAKSRFQRHTLLLGAVFVIILLWRLRPSVRLTLSAMSVNAFVIGAYAVYEALRGVARVDVNVTHAIHFGNTALALAAFSLAAVFSARNFRSPLFYIGMPGFVAGVTASILSGSRAGWLGLAVALIVVLALWGCRRHWHRVVVGILLMCALLAALWQIDIVEKRIHQSAAQWDTFADDKYARSSVGVRLVLWENAWVVFKEAPVLGSGFSSFHERVSAGIAAGELPKYYSRYKTEPHSEYLYQLSTRGLIGFTSILAIITWLAWRSSYLILTGDRSQEAVAAGPLIMLIVFAVAGLTITVLDQRYVINVFGYFISLSAYLLSTARIHREDDSLT